MTRNRRIKYPISVSDMWECGMKEPVWGNKSDLCAKPSSLCRGCQYYVNGKRVGQMACHFCLTIKEDYLDECWH